jgi:hypothetical protein
MLASAHKDPSSPQHVELSARLKLLAGLTKKGLFPPTVDASVCFQLLAASEDDLLRADVLRLLAASVDERMVGSWRRGFRFPGDKEGAFDCAKAHLAGNRFSFSLTVQVLGFVEALVRAKNDAPDLMWLLSFAKDTVFARLGQHEQIPGEKWLLCKACLKVFFAALETSKGPGSAGYWVLGSFLHESDMFARLLEVL